uniref:DUF4116 domain-containing protein n=1 Tax=Pinguiococcus pyrenoidosus TaxID=172671 RepID=A0A7R9UAL8_9STRA|mmetsp:Transcript_3164/g.12716  ORF Transcript_3164/g.12716 Transcript_3164/m.12716 type:complete len:383 (+) Transcript_3164:111-1259(+)|eukprot:scaffold2671_cov252-Pinguiococcus_pyrenoidosus.AAC.1
MSAPQAEQGPRWPNGEGKMPSWWYEVRDVSKKGGTVLDLTSWNIQVSGVEILVDHGLPFCPNLTNLFLGDNAIGDAGAEALADRGLRLCPELKLLDVFFGNIGPKGALALVERGLLHCPKLTTLYLEDNPVEHFSSVRDRTKFIVLLAENPSLTEVSGIKLCEHADILGLPSSLKDQPNKDVLSHLKERIDPMSRLLYENKELRHDREFVLGAVKQCGRSIRFVSPDLRRDKFVILSAVESRGNMCFKAETCAQMWSKIESFVDLDIVCRMRTWCKERHGVDVANAMSFNEVHAQYVSFPEGSAEDYKSFQNLGWVFRDSLDEEAGGELVSYIKSCSFGSCSAGEATCKRKVDDDDDDDGGGGGDDGGGGKKLAPAKKNRTK